MAGAPPARRKKFAGLAIDTNVPAVAGGNLTPIMPGSAHLVSPQSFGEKSPNFFPPCTPGKITYETPKAIIPNFLYLGGYCTPGFAPKELTSAFGFNCTNDARKNIVGIAYENVADTFDVNNIFRADDFPPALLCQFNRLVNAICQKLSEGKKVYVHCEAGKDRSPFVVTAVLLARNSDKTAEQVIDYLNKRYGERNHSVARNQEKLRQWFEWRKKQWRRKPEEMDLHPGHGYCCL